MLRFYRFVKKLLGSLLVMILGGVGLYLAIPVLNREILASPYVTEVLVAIETDNTHSIADPEKNCQAPQNHDCSLKKSRKTWVSTPRGLK